MSKARSPRIKTATPIETTEFKRFLKYLPLQIRTLVEAYKFASEAYAGIGLSYNWGELFRLPASSIQKWESGLCNICLYRSSRYGTSGELWFGHYLPDALAKKLIPLAQADQAGLLFQQEDGSASPLVVEMLVAAENNPLRYCSRSY